MFFRFSWWGTRAVQTWLLILLLALHAITAVFWAGSTFLLASGRLDVALAARPQLGASRVAVVTGALLFWLSHSSGFGPMELALTIGAVCAIVAAVVQHWMIRKNPLLSQRI